MTDDRRAKADIRAAASEALALIQAGDKQAAIERLTKTVEMWARRDGAGDD